MKDFDDEVEALYAPAASRRLTWPDRRDRRAKGQRESRLR